MAALGRLEAAGCAHGGRRRGADCCPGFGSGSLLVALAMSLIIVPLGRAAPIWTVRVKAAGPTVRLGFVHVTVPVPPTAGTVEVHPPGVVNGYERDRPEATCPTAHVGCDPRPGILDGDGVRNVGPGHDGIWESVFVDREIGNTSPAIAGPARSNTSIAAATATRSRPIGTLPGVAGERRGEPITGSPGEGRRGPKLRGSTDAMATATALRSFCQ